MCHMHPYIDISIHDRPQRHEVCVFVWNKHKDSYISISIHDRLDICVTCIPVLTYQYMIGLNDMKHVWLYDMCSSTTCLNDSMRCLMTWTTCLGVMSSSDSWHASMTLCHASLPQWHASMPQWLNAMPQWLYAMPHHLNDMPQCLNDMPQWLYDMPQTHQQDALKTHSIMCCHTLCFNDTSIACFNDSLRESGEGHLTEIGNSGV